MQSLVKLSIKSAMCSYYAAFGKVPMSVDILVEHQLLTHLPRRHDGSPMAVTTLAPEDQLPAETLGFVFDTHELRVFVSAFGLDTKAPFMVLPYEEEVIRPMKARKTSWYAKPIASEQPSTRDQSAAGKVGRRESVSADYYLSHDYSIPVRRLLAVKTNARQVLFNYANSNGRYPVSWTDALSTFGLVPANYSNAEDHSSKGGGNPYLLLEVNDSGTVCRQTYDPGVGVVDVSYFAFWTEEDGTFRQATLDPIGLRKFKVDEQSFEPLLRAALPSK